MRTTTKKLLAIALVGVMVASAGCAGWGTDGPADSDDGDSENNTGDDLADEQNQSQNQSNDSSRSNTSSGDSSTDSESDASSDSSSSSSSSSDPGTDSSDSSSDSSECPTEDCPDQSGDSDAGDSGSSDGDSTTDSDSTSDSDTPKDTTDKSGEKDTDEKKSDDTNGDQKDTSDGASEQPPDTSDGDSDGDNETPPDGDNGEPETHGLTVSVETPDGEPAKNLPVEVVTYDEGETVASTTTGENGQAVFSLENGEYEILVDVSDSEYTHTGTFLVEVAGEDTQYPIQLSETPGEGNETHELNVTVTDPNGDPVEGASVSIVTYDGGEDVASGTTNSDGVATFDVPNGEYEAVVTTENDELLQPSDQRLVTVEGEDANLDVQMQSSGDTGNGGGEETHTLTVHADSAVTLKSIDEEGVSETKEPTDGVVTFEVLNGEYTLTAEGYSRADYVPIDSDTEIELQSTDGATMDITVTDAETGDPVKGAEMDGECDLWYSGGDSYIETTSASGADGIVTVRTGVTPTTCEPTVSADGYETVTIGLDAPDDDGRTIELEPVETAVPEPPSNETGNETNGNATASVAV